MVVHAKSMPHTFPSKEEFVRWRERAGVGVMQAWPILDTMRMRKETEMGEWKQ